MRRSTMTRLFGIAGVQMSVVAVGRQMPRWTRWSDITTNIHKSFPWVQLIMFHELVVPGLVQFVTPENKDWWKKNGEADPGTADRASVRSWRAKRAVADARLDVRTGWRQTLQHRHCDLSAMERSLPNTARCSPGCPTKLGHRRGISSASSTFPMSGASGCASATTCGSRKSRAPWHGWAQR